MKRPSRGIKRLQLVLIILCGLLIISLSPIYPVRASYTSDKQELVALTFDDGYSCWTSEIMPILEEYGLTASGYINDPQYAPDYRTDFSWADAKQLLDAGWEIGWHTQKHISVDTASATEIENDFSSAQSLFESHGLPAPVTFAYPSGRHDSESMKIASKYFLASRTMETGPNSPNDVMNNSQGLKQYSLERGLSYIKQKINKYDHNGTLIVLAGHTVGEIAPWQKEPDMTVEDFKALAEFLHQQEQAGLIKVVTLSEGVNHIRQQSVKYSWQIMVDSPFDSWFRLWKIPFPERYYNFYQAVVYDFIGHQYPLVARWFERL